jgi:hypothetical protein
MIFFVGTKAIRYTGENGKKFWEGGARVAPIINNGDIIIVTEMVAYALTRKNKSFELLEPSDISEKNVKK